MEFNVKFKEWLTNEMAHFSTIKPFKIDDENIEIIDMKFERYPPSELKDQLLSIDSKFYGRIPNKHSFMAYDGSRAKMTPIPPEGFIELPEDWWDYAEAICDDGEIKHPTKGTEN